MWVVFCVGKSLGCDCIKIYALLRILSHGVLIQKNFGWNANLAMSEVF